MLKNKTTFIYLNGKVVSKETLKARKDATLNGVMTIEKKYYTTPLTDVEQEEERVKFANAQKFFSDRQEMREEQEKFH